MKRTLAGLLTCLLTVAIGMAHLPGEDMTTIDLGTGKVTIHYGTPKLGERNLDEMIQPGKAWFMGMNKPTTLETTVALDFGGKKLPAGKYVIFSRPDDKKNWTLLITTGTRTAFDPTTVVLEAPLHYMKETKGEDLLKITLKKTGAEGSLLVAWGTYRLHGTFKAAA